MSTQTEATASSMQLPIPEHAVPSRFLLLLWDIFVCARIWTKDYWDGQRENRGGSAACAGAGGVEEIVLADVYKAIFKAFCCPTSQTRSGGT
jgi:hypothetical protein